VIASSVPRTSRVPLRDHCSRVRRIAAPHTFASPMNAVDLAIVGNELVAID